MPKWRRPQFRGFQHTPLDGRAALNAAKERITQLVERGQMDEALPHLEQLVADYPNDTELLMMLGLCLYTLGEPDAALTYYERAYALSKQPGLLLPMGMAYLQLTMYSSALHAFTEANRRGLPLPAEMEPILAQLRQDISAVADLLGLSLDKAMRGLRDMELGSRWLERNDYRRAIEASRAAIKALGPWPPPHNNLALALFFDGQPAGAIAESRSVLAHEPENLMAAANLVRFLAWTGEREGAEAVWQTLRTRDPINLPDDALKLAETAAVLDDDEVVRRALLPLEKWEAEEFGDWRHYVQVQQFLATAEANLGNPKAAKRRLRALKDTPEARVQMLRQALRDGQKGFGLTPHFTYFHSIEMLPLARLQEFMELTANSEDDNPKAAKKLREFVARFPQLVLIGEKLIWEEDAVKAGIDLLRSLGTPAAHAALRRFAGSQAGSDEDRMQALFALQTSGGAQPGEIFSIWHDGAWVETELRGYAIGPRYEEVYYKANAVKLMADGMAAAKAGRVEEAITLLRKAVELEPQAYEAYNNLAAALDMSGDREGSKAMLERALAIKPDYVHARANLALKLLDEDPDAAAAVLAPLEGQTTFTPEEFTLFQLALAQVALAREQFDRARGYIEMARTIDPESEHAAMLLARIDMAEFSRQQGELWDRVREMTAEQAARYRQRQSARLETLTPTLDDVLGLFTVNLLRAMVAAVAPAQRLTGLRKADLQQVVRETLLDADSLRAVAGRLSETERAALAAVLAAGGAMPQAAFRAAYGDDTNESPWWGYHLPQSVAGRLRLHGLLAETTVGKTVYLAVPAELRAPLAAMLA